MPLNPQTPPAATACLVLHSETTGASLGSRADALVAGTGLSLCLSGTWMIQKHLFFTVWFVNF